MKSLNIALLACSTSTNKLDFQNIYRCANTYLIFLNKKYKTKQEILDHQHRMVFILLDWQRILGNGFTTLNPNQLSTQLKIYTTNKSDKLFKYYHSKYWNPKMNNNAIYFKWINDMHFCLTYYITFADFYWVNKNQKVLKRIDKTYYQFALTIYNTYLAHFKARK